MRKQARGESRSNTRKGESKLRSTVRADAKSFFVVDSKLRFRVGQLVIRKSETVIKKEKEENERGVL